MSDSQLEYVRRNFGVWQKTPRFDASILGILATGLDVTEVIEIANGIWREGYDEGFSEGYDQCNDGG